MVCLHPFWLAKEKFAVPCGRCIPCKIMRTHAWATRLQVEREYWSCAAFVTLTYDDEHLPPTLRPRHLQLFFKRLRKALSPRKIKYFACGEYGEKGGLVMAGSHAGQFVHRPHYHAIIFGVSPVSDRQTIQDCWKYCDWRMLSAKSIGTVTYDSCRYVAGYVQKKLYGEKAKETYNERNLAPFVRMSKGLGLNFALDNKELLEQSLGVGMRGYVVSLPHYFRDKLGIDPEMIKRKHEELVKNSFEDYLQSHGYTKSKRSEAMFNYKSFKEGRPLRERREIDLKNKLAIQSGDYFEEF